MYSLAERVIMVLRLFPSLIVQAIFPSAAKLYKEDPSKFYQFLKGVYIRVLLFGAVISVGAYLAAPWIILVLSKSELKESITYLQLLSVLPFLACLNIGNITIMLVCDLKDLLFKASWMMCLYMIAATAILTSLRGGVGLCIGIISTEVVVFLICLVLLYRHNRNLFHGFYS
jgi:O-antigen/teichoic acid export membrane protein